MIRLRAAAALFAVLLLASCGDGEPSRASRCIALFERMGEARFVGLPRDDGPAEEPRRLALDFEGSSPERIWYGRVQGRSIDYSEDAGPIGGIDPEGGLRGGALRLGPGLPQDASRAVLLLAAEGHSRIRISGRVRLEGNPLASEASSREVLRVVEHRRELRGSARPSRSSRIFGSTHRVSRRLDPSGWDRFELSFVAGSGTRSLEIQLLHKSGDSEEAVTRYDDLLIEQSAALDAELYGDLCGGYRPRDGRELETPWRLRVALRSQDRRRQETRDAVLLPPPAELSLPLRVPPAEARPSLRFSYGMLPEASRAAGDGARIEVAFRGPRGGSVPLGAVELDPKNDREHRAWLGARLDLAEVAGREGRISFRSTDIPGSPPDALDAVLIATPRVEAEAEPPADLNVLLVGVDTLRADRMSAFGYGRPTTPALERLADAGIRFARARSQAPWTLPSFASISTSLYPSAHGAGRGGHDEWTPIDPGTTSLAEVLAAHGYETHGIVANGLISPEYGLDQGFEAYGCTWTMESVEQDAPAVVAFVEEHRATPWFLFWHIMDPHLPYLTDGSFREEFTDPGYEGRFASDRGAMVPFQALDPRPGRRWFAHEGPPPPPNLSEGDRRFVGDYYDAEIAEMDAAVGRVLDALRESGQWERTIVAFIADHGEGLGDHDHYHHGYTLFDDQVHVPMLLRIPGRDEGRVIDRPVAAIDLAPTILGALGIEPPADFQGVDRLSVDAPEDDAFFIEYPTYDSSAQKAWIRGDFKYLHDPVFRTEALYDLGRDPGETRDAAAEHPELVLQARAEMDAFRWEQLQKGRFHLRISGALGQRLQLTIATDDLFDANFASRPILPDERFEMDLERRHLSLDTVLEQERLELVFWCRGSELSVDLRLDGDRAPGGLVLAGEEEARELETRLSREKIPRRTGQEFPWPGPGRALLWLEPGLAELDPVLLDPEEIERLRELGYTR